MPKFTVSYPSGATPIDPDELHDLIPDYISTQGELNRLEQSNIADAFVWAGKQKRDDLLSVSFLLKLHKKMFDQVWKWAGETRKSDKNIGVPYPNIMTDLGILIGDTKFWIEKKTYSADEIAVRFHHRLVQIHVFPNGNGRHARLLTDQLVRRMGEKKFTWGSLKSKNPIDIEGETRSAYISALKKADQGDFSDLLLFVRS